MGVNRAPGQPPLRYIPTLDGWRAVAISLVIVSHGLTGAFPAASKLGALGVSLFFALSGYLICTLLLIEREDTGRISLTAFYKRRIFRIIPPALAYLVVLGLLGALGVVALRKGELVSAFYAANYFHNRSWFTEHFWSLSMEEHFYLFWPAILMLAGPRKARISALVIVGALLVYRPWGERTFDASSYQHTDMRLDSFLLPCVLAILLRQPAWRQRFVNLLRPWVCALLGAVVFVLAAFAAAHPAWGNAQKFIQAGILPLLIASTVLRPSFLGVLLELPVTRWVGRISYSLYLWQQLFLFHVQPGPSFWLRLPLIFLFAACSFYLIERPMIRLGHRVERASALAPPLDLTVRVSAS